jgi:predicted nucleic acid-binding Zn ribbon protein
VPRGDDRRTRDLRANAADRWGADPYSKRRAQAAARRAAEDRRPYDPPTDDDWTLADEDERLRILRRPEALGSLLEGFVASRRWETRVRGATVFSRWTDIVGPDLAARCEPVRLARGNLLVRAENASWATQLKYMLTHVAEKANDVLGSDMVRQVSVVVGPLQGTARLDDEPGA